MEIDDDDIDSEAFNTPEHSILLLLSEVIQVVDSMNTHIDGGNCPCIMVSFDDKALKTAKSLADCIDGYTGKVKWSCRVEKSSRSVPSTIDDFRRGVTNTKKREPVWALLLTPSRYADSLLFTYGQMSGPDLRFEHNFWSANKDFCMLASDDLDGVVDRVADCIKNFRNVLQE